MEASALPRSAALPRPRLAVSAPLLRLRSDEQLVALFRGGSDDAFGAIHDRYRARLLAYARQMLGGSAADAEDALQEVFVRAHAALRTSSAPISLRAWLYRIAHNRCVDQLRRPAPIPSLIAPGAEPALSRGPRHDPPAEAERSEDLRRLVADVHSLPEQQRSALLMRELQGLSYEELSVALGISVAAVKSVLLRARGGVLDAAEARETPCTEIRLELVGAHDRGVRASGRARRHMRECDGCCAYRGELRAVRRQVAGLVPAGPLGHLGLLFGLGGGGAGGGLAAGGSTAALGGAASLTASKVAAIVCCAALVGGAGALRSQTPAHASHAGLVAPVRHPALPSPAALRDARTVARIAGGAVAPAAARPRPSTAVPAGHRTAPAEPALTGQDTYGPTTPASPPDAAGPPSSLGPAPAGDPTAPAEATGAGEPAADPASATVAPSAAGTAGTPAAAGQSAATSPPTAAPPPSGAPTTDAVPQPQATATSWRGLGGRRTWRRRPGWSRPARTAAAAPAPAPVQPAVPASGQS
jgi:RNA polymerase sigma factor (sigma-70 family)